MVDDYVVTPADLVIVEAEHGGLSLKCVHCGINVLEGTPDESQREARMTLATLLDGATRHALARHAGWFPGWTEWP
jgi:hypothetical protein